MKFFFLTSSQNWNVEKEKLNLEVSNSKFNLIFYKVELVTRKKNFYQNFWVSNSKYDVILCNSVKQLDLVTREFWTSVCFSICDLLVVSRTKPLLWVLNKTIRYFATSSIKLLQFLGSGHLKPHFLRLLFI